MIFVFGSVLQLIRVETDADNSIAPYEFAKHYKNSVGGKGALQSLAAAKTGAKTAIVSRTGDDELSKHILFRLRKHGVVTSGVAKDDNMQTGTSVRLEHEHRTIIALGANTGALAEQVPVESLSEKSVVLMQTELGTEQNSKLLQMARENGAKTILNASPRFEFSEDDLPNIDYMIVGLNNKDKWEEQVGAKESAKHIITIFISPKGEIELNMRGTTSPIPKAKLEGLDWKYPESYEDAFCGTFAAGLYDGLPMDKILLRAHIASALTASRSGGYDTIPYSDEVEETLKALAKA